MIYFGTRLFGMVHWVPGRFHVLTKFGHVFFIPLIPLESWIVTKETDRGWEGRPIGISLFSIVMAWLRAALVLTYLGIAVWMFAEIFTEHLPRSGISGAAFAIVSLLCLVVFRLTYRLSVASTKTAQLLALKLGYSEADAALVEVPRGARFFGRPGWGFAIALVPLLAWVVTGMVMGRFVLAHGHSLPLEALRARRTGDSPYDVSNVLDKLGPPTAAGVDVYRKYLSDPDAKVRYGAAMALSKIGDPARQALPELKQGLKDRDPKVRQLCADILAKIGSGYEDAVDDLIKMVSDESPATQVVFGRAAAAEALGMLGPAAQRAIPHLEQASTANEASVRQRSIEALDKIRKPAP